MLAKLMPKSLKTREVFKGELKPNSRIFTKFSLRWHRPELPTSDAQHTSQRFTDACTPTREPLYFHVLFTRLMFLFMSELRETRVTCQRENQERNGTAQF